MKELDQLVNPSDVPPWAPTYLCELASDLWEEIQEVEDWSNLETDYGLRRAKELRQVREIEYPLIYRLTHTAGMEWVWKKLAAYADELQTRNAVTRVVFEFYSAIDLAFTDVRPIDLKTRSNLRSELRSLDRHLTGIERSIRRLGLDHEPIYAIFRASEKKTLIRVEGESIYASELVELLRSKMEGELDKSHLLSKDQNVEIIYFVRRLVLYLRKKDIHTPLTPTLIAKTARAVFPEFDGDESNIRGMLQNT